MKTTKPCSTISYNSKEFLTTKLNDLVNRRLIDFWCFVQHLAEEDEEKPHKHLHIVPNGQIDTDQIKEYLTELNPNDISKPFGCIWFQSSKWDDWYFYELHDEEYLASKGQVRKYHYTEDEFVYSSKDYFTQLKHRIDYSKVGNKKTKTVLTEIKSGESLVGLLDRGLISPQNYMQWEKIYNSLVLGHTFRADRQTHTPILIDQENGAVEDGSKIDACFEVASWQKRGEK